jgi:hypothetical protein
MNFNFTNRMSHLKYIIFCCLFFCTIEAMSQLNATYIFIINDKIDGTIQLNEKYKYEINIDYNISDDNSFSFLLSEGSYRQANEELILSDAFNHYSLRFKILKNAKPNKEKLISINSFSWMQNRKIEKIKDYTNIQEQKIVSKTKMNKLKRNYKRNTLYYAEYKDFDFTDCNVFKLKFCKPNTYKLKFYEFVISDGIFNKKRDEIVLHDIALNHDFYCYILKDYLKCMFVESTINLKFKPQ